MSILDSGLGAITAAVLRGAKAAKIKQFTFEGHTFVQGHLAHMATEITHPQGALSVEYDSSLNGLAEYDSSDNTLFLGFLFPDSISKGALIVHEATHALFDFKASNMDIATSESIAYIAQCQFARANSSNPNIRLFSDNASKDKVFEIGWRLAGKVLNGNSFTAADITDMRNAISQHPFYSGKHSNGANFDGM